MEGNINFCTRHETINGVIKNFSIPAARLNCNKFLIRYQFPQRREVHRSNFFPRRLACLPTINHGNSCPKQITFNYNELTPRFMQYDFESLSRTHPNCNRTLNNSFSISFSFSSRFSFFLLHLQYPEIISNDDIQSRYRS